MSTTNDIDSFVGGEGPDIMDGGSMKGSSFLNYITSFSSKEKAQMYNLMQYGGLVIIPILIVLKLMKQYIPPSDPFKSSTELLIEVVLQLIVIVLSFFFIHKLVLYVPTYSKVEYENINLLSGILPLFFLMFTLDTNISEKLNVLFDRLLTIIGLKKEGMDGKEQEETNKGDTIVPQLSQQTISQCGSNTMMNSPMENRLIDGHPTKREIDPMLTSQMMPQNGSEMMMQDEPMAANSIFGGGSSFF